MYPASFDYHRATSVDDVFRLLSEHEDAKLIAGGHSLIPMMKLRLAQPEQIIDISQVDGLSGISQEGDQIRIGALTTHAQLASSELLQAECDLIAQAAREVGDVQVRNVGTLGGNIAHADPGSDLPAALMAVGARVHLQSSDGSRTVAASDFFVDLLTTDLGANEILTSVTVSPLGSGTGSAYRKFEHPASGYAVVGAAATVTMDGDRCTAASLAINGVTATPYDGSAVAAALVGGPASDEAIQTAVQEITPEDPMSDIFAGGDYRAHLARVYAARALIAARG